MKTKKMKDKKSQKKSNMTIIDFPSSYNLKKNILKENIFIAVLAIIFLTLGLAENYSLINSLIFALIIFIIPFIRNKTEYEIYIYQITLIGSTLLIKYKKDGELKEYKSDLKNINIKQKYRHSAGRRLYLIFYNSNISLKQFAIGDWGYSEIKEVYNMLNDLK